MTRSRRTDAHEETESQVSRPDADDLRILVSAPLGTRSYPLIRRRRVVLGRGIHCDVVIDDASASRAHARIDFTSSVPLLEDLASRNGTTILGRKLDKEEQAPLQVGSSFEIGAVMVIVQRAIADATTAADSLPVVEDPAMRALYASLDAIAPSPLSVLILGETGTGKEVLAEAIHARSPRRARPFLAINCAALSETLLESELFGHEKGAFTGASHAKMGLFEAAEGGTVFLDEVGELAPSTQAKLLRVLENGEVTPLGSVKTRRVDVRFLAATNRDVRALRQSDRFRADLYYRLSGLPITIPPLRQRRADIRPLSDRFARRAAAYLDRQAPEIREDTRKALEEHAWPGNVRELRNVVERAVTLSMGASVLEPKHLHLGGEEADAGELAWQPQRASSPTMPPTPGLTPPADFAKSPEKARLLEALHRTSGNQTEAAKLLGISRRTLINRIVGFGIARPRKGKA